MNDPYGWREYCLQQRGTSARFESDVRVLMRLCLETGITPGQLREEMSEDEIRQFIKLFKELRG